MDIVDRMFKLVDEQFKEQKDFAKAVDVKPQRVSEWRLRKSHSYVKRLEIISNVLGVTPAYLLTGEEPKYEIRPILSDDAIAVAVEYDFATPELQAAVRRVLGIE